MCSTSTMEFGPVSYTHLIIVSHVRCDGDIFEELLPGAFEIVLPPVLGSQEVMHQRQLGIDARGLLELVHSAVVHPGAHVRLADNHVELRRVMAGFDQAGGGAPIEIRKAGLVGGDGH